MSRPEPAPVENIQDIVKETQNAINEIKDEILETAETIKNEWVFVPNPHLLKLMMFLSY